MQFNILQSPEPVYERIYWRWFHWYYRLLQDHIEFSNITLPGEVDYISVGPLQITRLAMGGSKTFTKAGVVWNGASFAPDFRQVIRGTLHHDKIYEFIQEIAIELQVSVKEVRLWSDQVFNEINQREGLWELICRIYFLAVRKFGGFIKREVREVKKRYYEKKKANLEKQQNVQSQLNKEP